MVNFLSMMLLYFWQIIITLKKIKLLNKIKIFLKNLNRNYKMISNETFISNKIIIQKYKYRQNK